MALNDCNRTPSRTAASGHFQTKSEAASLAIYWSGPPTGADVLHLAFVLNNVLGAPT